LKTTQSLGGGTGKVEKLFRRSIITLANQKGLIDKIDLNVAKHYGLTAEETDFIINYDIKYRMGGTDDEE
jgi:hypothetical protein